MEWVIILFLLALSFLWTSCNDGPLRTLPIYGPTNEETKASHHVSPFSLIDQNGDTITNHTFDGKIYVADFFFTTCRSICPVMSTQMERVAAKYANNPNVLIISHSVNPEYDTPAVLKEYANMHHAVSGKWFFVTGDKKQIYDLARTSYLSIASKGDGGPDDFIHTQNFALVDKEKRLRGYYDGTDSTDVSRLLTDIDLLLQENK
ncbi:MAG: SCO family protein [Bacteroidetes bacterium]|jgi:protein SCO1/2|nr:SCO family protein [Bacteroidota bacterium]